jgi:hypothetical protein
MWFGWDFIGWAVVPVKKGITSFFNRVTGATLV